MSERISLVNGRSFTTFTQSFNRSWACQHLQLLRIFTLQKYGVWLKFWCTFMNSMPRKSLLLSPIIVFTFKLPAIQCCNKSVNILRQLVTTSRYHDVFMLFVIWFVDNKSVASWLSKLLSTGLLQVVSTSCNQSANE